MGDGETSISERAQLAFVAEARKPPFLTAWQDALFVHFAVDPAVLQPQVPFPLDLFGGEAYVSAVLFTQYRFRPRLGGAVSGWLARPVAEYRFCNVRTYVRVGGEGGVYFLVEWIDNLPSLLLARAAYGLPYRRARSSYRLEAGNRFRGEVQAGGRCFEVEAEWAGEAQPARAGSLDEFVLERYNAFTLARGRRLRFRIWHRPWKQQAARAEVREDGLLEITGPWYRQARLAGANHSGGTGEVWIGWPHRLPPG